MTLSLSKYSIMAVFGMLIFTTPSFYGLQLHELVEIPPSDSSFNNYLAERFPGLEEATYFQRLKPYILIIRNDSPYHIKGYSVMWKMNSISGQSKSTTTTYVLRHHTPVAQDQSLRPGSVRVISPFFNFSPSQWKILGAAHEVISASTVPLAENHNVTVNISGVIYGGKDPFITGESSKKLEEEYVAVRHADHDEGLSVMSRLSRNLPDVEILEMLSSHRALKPLLTMDESKKMYLAERSRISGDLLNAYKLHGRQGLKILAKELASYSRERSLTHG